MQIFEHSIIHNPSHVPWGHVRSHTKFGPDRFNRFDRQTNKIYIYIHTLLVRLCPINVKTTEPDGPKFCVVYLTCPQRSFMESTKFLYKICKIFVCFCFYNVYKEKMFTIEIDDGREA